MYTRSGTRAGSDTRSGTRAGSEAGSRRPPCFRARLREVGGNVLRAYPNQAPPGCAGTHASLPCTHTRTHTRTHTHTHTNTHVRRTPPCRSAAEPSASGSVQAADQARRALGQASPGFCNLKSIKESLGISSQVVSRPRERLDRLRRSPSRKRRPCRAQPRRRLSPAQHRPQAARGEEPGSSSRCLLQGSEAEQLAPAAAVQARPRSLPPPARSVVGTGLSPAAAPGSATGLRADRQGASSRRASPAGSRHALGPAPARWGCSCLGPVTSTCV